MDNHVDSDAFGFTAYQTWWLELSEKYMSAHFRLQRTVAAYLHDLTKVRTGPMPEGPREAFRQRGGQSGSRVQRQEQTRTHHLDWYGGTRESQLLGETRDDWPSEAISEFYIAMNEGLRNQTRDNMDHLSVSQQMGMTALQFMHDAGGAWLFARSPDARAELERNNLSLRAHAQAAAEIAAAGRGTGNF